MNRKEKIPHPNPLPFRKGKGVDYRPAGIFSLVQGFNARNLRGILPPSEMEKESSAPVLHILLSHQ